MADDSAVETFAALEVWVDTWRWSGVPFYLRTGKAMAEGRRTVTIGFTEAPLRIFPDQHPTEARRPSELVFELSDDPQVRIEVQAKIPGPTLSLGHASLQLDVDEAFDGHDGLEAYERLLHDVMLRERLLFTRSEQIERLWEVSSRCSTTGRRPSPTPRGRGVRTTRSRCPVSTAGGFRPSRTRDGRRRHPVGDASRSVSVPRPSR